IGLTLSAREIMHEFDREKATNSIEKLMGSAFLQSMGKPVWTDEVVQAKTAKQVVKRSDAPMYGQVCLAASNFQANLMREKLGKDWFNRRWNANVRAADAIVSKFRPAKKIRQQLDAFDIPVKFEIGTDLVFRLTKDLMMIALSRGYGIPPRNSFAISRFERCFKKGHIPCGWTGRLPSLPKTPPGVSSYSGLSLDDVIGEGKLIVF
uniref:hypothetical protein n=1 Tax=Roseiconus lacunae TaxID=2605694 RepID=UPI00193F482A